MIHRVLIALALLVVALELMFLAMLMFLDPHIWIFICSMPVGILAMYFLAMAMAILRGWN